MSGLVTTCSTKAYACMYQHWRQARGEWLQTALLRSNSSSLPHKLERPGPHLQTSQPAIYQTRWQVSKPSLLHELERGIPHLKVTLLMLQLLLLPCTHLPCRHAGADRQVNQSG